MQKRRHNIRKRKAEKHKRTVHLLGLFFMCFLFIYGTFFLVCYLQVQKVPKNKVCDGIFIGRTEVSGLTRKEAMKRVEEQEARYGQKNITFEAEGQQANATLKELGFEIRNEEKLIEEAMKYGKEGGVIHRYLKVRKLNKEKKVLQPKYAVQKEAASGILNERVSGLLTGATDAVITRSDEEFLITDEKDGVELDMEATLQKLSKFLNKEWEGESGTISVVEKVQKPRVTKKQLSEVQDLLGSFSTYCGSGTDRVKNIQVGTGRLNGKVLMPGEELSAGAAMRPFTAETGYVEAGAYENGEIVKDIAGGICQVSTTLYNAAIYAELEVTSRQPHSMVVNYVKPSRDAAIAGDYKDLKFKNNTEYPIYIEGYVAGGIIHFNIYGKETRPEGRKVEFVSETLSKEEIVKKYVEDPELELGQIVKPSGGHTGGDARLWKVVYENGKEVSREVFNKSTYKPSVHKIRVGTKSDNPTAVKKVKDAIRTQDEGKITAAVSEVKGL